MFTSQQRSTIKTLAKEVIESQARKAWSGFSRPAMSVMWFRRDMQSGGPILIITFSDGSQLNYVGGVFSEHFAAEQDKDERGQG